MSKYDEQERKAAQRQGDPGGSELPLYPSRAEQRESQLDPSFYRPTARPIPTTYPDDLPCVEKAVKEAEEEQGLPNEEASTVPWSVPDLSRPQQERVESFVSFLRDISAKFKLGHMVLVYEGEFEGRAGVYQLSNLELHSDAREWLMMLFTAAVHINNHPPVGDAEIGFENWLKRERARVESLKEKESK